MGIEENQMALTTNPAFNFFFAEFSTYLDAHYSRPANLAEKEKIKNGPKRIRRLDSLARLIVKGDTQNCAAVALVNKTWYVTANNYSGIQQNITQIFVALSKVKKSASGVISTRDARTYLLEKYLKSVKNTPNIRSRLKKDVRKFLSALKTNEVFKQSAINNLLNDGFHYYKNKCQLHAEMRLLSGLADSSSTKAMKVTLGISKLCCKLCAAGIRAFQNTHENFKIHFRGRHGNFYYAWKPSDYLITHCFREFVGEEAFDEYTKATRANKKMIIKALQNLDENRDHLKSFFQPSRGGVTLNSESAEPPSTEDSTSSDDLSFDDVESSEQPDDSDTSGTE